MSKKINLFNLIVAICCLLNVSCVKASSSSAENLFIASTPGDDPVKLIFGIPVEKKIDFIKWNLSFNQDNKFTLNINFGESQPNTNGFKNGGEKLTFNGNFIVKGDVYELKSENFSSPLTLMKVNENLFHLLTPDRKLMIGNGGWSYTLNKRSGEKLTNFWKSKVPNEIFKEAVFEGRTPCLEIAKHYNLQVGNDCIKIKWRLTLFRDAVTNEPTKFALRWIKYDPNLIEGNWKIKKSSDSVIYQLELDKSAETLSFLVGDENILFFLDKENQLFTGNSDFSFTLNRRK
jgi:hypothetical protein